MTKQSVGFSYPPQLNPAVSNLKESAERPTNHISRPNNQRTPEQGHVND
jgi:hypothetical protein